jgi:hypothetical protein
MMAVDFRYYLDVFKYDILRMSQHFDYSIMPTSLQFESHYDRESDLHWLEMPELPGFYVTGKDKVELARNVGDTLLVYFDVPTYFAKKWKPDTTTFNFENQKTGEHEYVSLDYLEELHKQAAA